MNKGTSANLMKFTAKRRRSKQQIKEQKLQEEREKNAVVGKMAEIDELKQQLAEM